MLHSRLGATMVYVTHDQVEAMTMGDRIVVMKDGVVQQIGAPLNLYDRPTNRFVAGFIGTPAMNFMEGMLSPDGNGGLVFEEGQVHIGISSKYAEYLRDYVGREVVFGIRPEDIFDPRLSESAEEKATIQARVEVVEPMGNEIYLDLTTGKTPFVARIDTAHVPNVGDEMELVLDVSRARFFDRDTEEALL